MFVIDVVPFSRNAPAGALSYRSRERLAIGTIVSVPLRRQTVNGIVVMCTAVRDAKAALKTANFTLRRGALRTTGQLPKSYRAAAQHVAEYHAVSLGSAYRALLGEAILSRTFPSRLSMGTGADVAYFEAPYEKRIEKYKGYVSDAGSVLIVAPTTIEVARFAGMIEDAVAVTGELSPKRRTLALGAAQRASVIVTTPSYAYTPIERLAHIVIERESAGSYVGITSPHLDMRVAIRALADARGVPVTIGDYPLRLDIRPVAGAPLAQTLQTPIKIIDVREKKTDAPARTFKATPEKMRSALAQTLAQGGRAIVIAVRKGYAPAVVCRDCGTSVRDAQGRALSLATTGGERVLRSTDGTVLRSARALCDVCGSWNLLPLGIGVERVAEELTQTLPNTCVVRFDGDTIKTPAAARRAAAKFLEPGTLIVGTEAVLPWLDIETPVQLSAIASADALLALPFWRSRERLVRLALALAQHSDRLLIATRRPDDVVFSALAEPTASSFFAEESSLRKTLHYPPYGHLLAVRIEGTQSRLDEGEALVRSALAPHKPARLPDRHTPARGMVRTLVIKTAPHEWPDATLAKRIAQLPPWVTLRVDSESLW